MPCIFIESCNEKVRKSTWEAFCNSDTQKYIYCDVYKGILDPMKRPIEWSQEKHKLRSKD